MEEADAVHNRILEMRSGQNFKSSGEAECSKSSIEVDESEHNLLKNGSAPYSHPNASKSCIINTDVNCLDSGKPQHFHTDEIASESNGFDFNFIRRFLYLHKLIFESCCSPSCGLLLFFILLCCLQEYLFYKVGLIPSAYYRVLTEKDWPGFQKHTLVALGFIVAVTFIKSITAYVQKILYAVWRQNICRYLHNSYFEDIRFYQLNVLDKSIDNPDQRMTQDVDKFCSTYCDILPKLLVTPFVIMYYCYLVYVRCGWQGPLSSFGFFVAASIVNKILMSPIVKFVVKQEKCEGDFRFIHMLIRVNSESIAFLNAGSIEKTKVNDALGTLISTQQRLFFRQFFLNCAVNLFDYLGSIISYLMLAIPLFSGDYDHLKPSELSQLISENSFVLMYLIFKFTNLLDLATKFTDVAGVVHRVCQLKEKLDTLREFWNEVNLATNESSWVSSEIVNKWKTHRDTNGSPGNHSRLLPAWILKNLTFCPPMSTTKLVDNLTMSFSVGESVLISGGSSVGKSSLLRILRGLWPYSEGTLLRYFPPGPTAVFYCPQKPYVTYGSLREQIIFPLKKADVVSDEDDQIIHYLHVLKLNSLFDRIGGLDVCAPWNIYESLSPGEMQRLGFMRVFYHRPLIAVLDEATSALPLEMENIVYMECRKLGISTISVGHRDSLRNYHDKMLTLMSGGSWKFEPIVPSNDSQTQ